MGGTILQALVDPVLSEATASLIGGALFEAAAAFFITAFVGSALSLEPTAALVGTFDGVAGLVCPADSAVESTGAFFAAAVLDINDAG